MEEPGPSQQRSRAPRAARAVWLALGAAGLVLLAGLLVLPWMWLALFEAVDAQPAPVAVSAPPPDLPELPPPRPRPVVMAAAAKPDAEQPQVEPRDDPGPGQLESDGPDITIVDEEERNAPYVPQAVPYEGPTGMELFPPVGSKPLRTGIIVPDDFELPEGFVRHYQVSDDGEELPPVLAFHPDYVHYDANGEPVDTRDRIVPPELAPEGLPIHLLELPEPEDAGE